VSDGLDGGHAPAGIALMAGALEGVLDAWASSPTGFYTCATQHSHVRDWAPMVEWDRIARRPFRAVDAAQG